MNHLKAFLCEDDGVGVIEIVLILVVLIALVVIFKNNITEMVGKAFEKINGNSNNVIDNEYF